MRVRVVWDIVASATPIPGWPQCRAAGDLPTSPDDPYGFAYSTCTEEDVVVVGGPRLAQMQLRMDWAVATLRSTVSLKPVRDAITVDDSVPLATNSLWVQQQSKPEGGPPVHLCVFWGRTV